MRLSANRQLEWRLSRLGIRKQGDFKLHSGGRSNVKWDIEDLFCSAIVEPADKDDIIRLFAEMICPKNPVRRLISRKRKPDCIFGIGSGGYMLARALACYWGGCGYQSIDREGYTAFSDSYRILLVDDVCTTGTSLKDALKHISGNISVAVLINRSSWSDINGLPVISGACLDYVVGTSPTTQSHQF